MRMPLIGVLVVFALIAGCAKGKPMAWFDKESSWAGYGAIEVEPVVNETGKSYDFDVAGELTKAIRARLSDKGDAIAEYPFQEEGVLVLKSALTLFQPGNAFKRWLLRGYGTTACRVKSTLIDKATGKIVGEIVVEKSVSTGGWYTVGANTRVVGEIADDIVLKLHHAIKEVKK